MSTYPSPAPRRFGELRASEVPLRCSERSLLIQPIASIEQHGPHLPLATDLMVCEATSEAAVARSNMTTPARRLVFVNGHGGNTSLLDVAARDFHQKYPGLMTFLVHPSVPPDDTLAEIARFEFEK